MLQRTSGCVDERSVTLIDVQDIVRRAVVRDIDVRPAISVHVGDDDAQAKAGIPQYAGFPGDIRERSVTAVPVEQVVTARRLTAHTRWVAPDATRKILRRIVEKEEVEASVPVVVQEGGVGREVGVGDPVLCSSFGEGPIAVVDEQQIRALLRLRPFGSRNGHIDIQIPVVVDVHHRRAGGPSVRVDARPLGDIIEPHLPFVQVEAARDHVAGKEDVRQSVVVDITDRYAGAVVHVDVSLNIERVVGCDGVHEGDAGLLRAQELEYRTTTLSRAAG